MALDTFSALAQNPPTPTLLTFLCQPLIYSHPTLVGLMDTEGTQLQGQTVPPVWDLGQNDSQRGQGG
jgi:hypothetical protein